MKDGHFEDICPYYREVRKSQQVSGKNKRAGKKFYFLNKSA